MKSIPRAKLKIQRMKIHVGENFSELFLLFILGIGGQPLPCSLILDPCSSLSNGSLSPLCPSLKRVYFSLLLSLPNESLSLFVSNWSLSLLGSLSISQMSLGKCNGESLSPWNILFVFIEYKTEFKSPVIFPIFPHFFHLLLLIMLSSLYSHFRLHFIFSFIPLID